MKGPGNLFRGDAPLPISNYLLQSVLPLQALFFLVESELIGSRSCSASSGLMFEPDGGLGLIAYFSDKAGESRSRIKESSG